MLLGIFILFFDALCVEKFKDFLKAFCRQVVLNCIPLGMSLSQASILILFRSFWACKRNDEVHDIVLVVATLSIFFVCGHESCVPM